MFRFFLHFFIWTAIFHRYAKNNSHIIQNFYAETCGKC